jgi:hypothetical protein
MKAVLSRMFTIHFYRFLLEKENFVTLGITEIYYYLIHSVGNSKR